MAALHGSSPTAVSTVGVQLVLGQQRPSDMHCVTQVTWVRWARCCALHGIMRMRMMRRKRLAWVDKGVKPGCLSLHTVDRGL